MLATIVILLPNFSFIPSIAQLDFLPDTRIRLGLDLRGGLNLTLGVDVNKAVENSLSLTGQDIRQAAAEKNIVILRPHLNAEGQLTFLLPNAQQVDALTALISAQFPQVLLTLEAPQAGHSERSFTATFTPAHHDQLATQAMDQTVRTLRNRIDQFGVAEPDIREQGSDQIQIQLPGMNDPERAKQLLGQTAVLTFHAVRDDIRPPMLPPGTALFPMENGETLVLNTEPLMTGQDVADARPGFDEQNRSNVSLQLNNHGAAAFERITEELLHQRLAIVLDGVVASAPVIQQKIAGGRASISGTFTTDEAQDLAIVLRAGSLPAPVSILEERAVGPSLGAESIHSGLTAGLVGALAVMIIMQLVYGRCGFQANILLFFTVALLLAGLGIFGATLTLPGIAGIVLTIGMAVDANVLIFERIREELRHGCTPAMAVHHGFDRASLSITDANLTTIIAAVILYQFGTGPVRGFAVTLSLGIFASMFTALFVSRLLFEAWIQRNGGKNLGLI